MTILFLKLGQSYYQASFPSHVFCANVMKVDAIFQDLEHLYNFQTVSHGGNFVVQNEAKILHRHVWIA